MANPQRITPPAFLRVTVSFSEVGIVVLEREVGSPGSGVWGEVDRYYVNVTNRDYDVPYVTVFRLRAIAGAATLTLGSVNPVVAPTDTAWGEVTGTLSDQEDLNTALAGKATLSHTHDLSDITDAGALAALNTVGTSQIDANAVTTAKMNDLGVAGTYSLGGGGSITFDASGRCTAITPPGSSSADASIDYTIPGNVADGTYILILKAPVAITINSLAAKLNSGTCNVKLTIDGVDVTGITALAVSSNEDFDDATAANSVAVGQTVAMVVSGQSSANTLSITMKATET